MKLVTRDTDYAIRALLLISRQVRVVSVPELVVKLKIPRPFLRKILQILNKRNLLKSCRGPGGGFRLNMPLDKIYLLDLIKIFQGPLKLNECLFKRRICPNINSCVLRKKILNIEKHMFKELKTITLASLLGGGY